MKNFNTFHRGSAFKAANFRAFVRFARITSGAHDDGECHVVEPAHAHFIERAIAAGEQQRDQIVFQPQHQHLRFGVAEAAIVFDQLRTVRGENQPGIEHTNIRVTHITQCTDGRLDDFFQRFFAKRRCHAGSWRIGAHAAGVGAGIAFTNSFMILRGGQRQGVSAVGEDEEARFLAFKELLDDAFGAAELAREDVVQCAASFRHFHGNGDALAGRQPIGLDDDRYTPRLEIGKCRRLVGEAAIGGGGDAIRGADVLGEALGTFELGGKFCRPEDLDAAAQKIIGKARHQWRLRSHHHETDALGLAESDNGGVICHRHILQPGDLADTGIAGGHEELVAQGAVGDGPGQRMLAAARPDEEDFHARARPCFSAPCRI